VPSIFTRMTDLARRCDAINLAQGVPDFGPPPELIDAARRAVDGEAHQYPPSAGSSALREAVACHAREVYGIEYDPDEVTITAGATEGLWSSVFALVEPGDEAVVIEPAYELYPACIAAAGATVKYVTTEPPEFRLDLQAVREAVGPKTRLLIVNTPANPSGACLGRSDIKAIGEIAEAAGAVVISDETYEHIYFDRASHVPVAADDLCRTRTVTVSSISKTFSATGWRIGWTLAPRALTERIRNVHQFVVFSATAPLQEAVAEMLQVSIAGDYFDRLRRDYEARRGAIKRALERAGLDPLLPDGAYFALAQVAGDDVDYCYRLIEESRVAALPVSSFFHRPTPERGLVRFAFCKRLETLEEAGDRLSGESAGRIPK
jgi:N-succinyldiaminopimelate aminotransferase